MQEMMRLRLASGEMELPDEFNQLWNSICVSHFKGEHSFYYMVDHCIMRPRNLIKIFLHIKAHAVNMAHDKISEEDIEKGLLHYSHDILEEACREIADIEPSADQLLYHFIDGKKVYSPEEIKQIIKNANIDNSKIEKIINSMLYFGFFGILNEKNEITYIYDVKYNEKILNARLKKIGGILKYHMNPAFWPSLSIQ